MNVIWKNIRTLTVMLLMASLFVVGCSKPAGQKEMEAGMRELKRDNYVRAKALFEKSIARRPGHIDNAMAHNYLGIAAWRLGQFQDAMTAFEDSRRLNPNLIEPVYNLGVLSAERDDMRNAVRYLNEAATMNRDDPRPLEYLAELHFQRSQWQPARNALYSALDREPRSARIYHSIALAHVGMEQPQQAIESFMHALEADTKYAPALFNLAVVYDTKMGDADQARAFYKRFVSVAPRDANVPAARAALARIDQRGALVSPGAVDADAGSSAGAGETLPGLSSEVTRPPVEVPVIPPSPPTPPPPTTVTARAETPRESPYDALLKQAEERGKSGQVQQAIDLYVRAAESAAGDRRTDLQEKAYREAVRVALDQPRAHVLLAQHLYERGRFDQAARSFRQAATLNADYAPAQLGLARLAARGSELDAAIVHYRKAISSDPTLADAQWELAELYDRNLELPENAARTYREFARNFSGDARRDQALKRAEILAPTPKPDPQVIARSGGAAGRPPEVSSGRRLDYRVPTTRNTDAAIQSFNRASVYQEQKDWDRAVYFYLRSLENDDQIPSAFYNLGICYTMKGDYELARAAYHQALQLQPGLVDAQYNLALLYREAKDDAAAVRLLEEVVGSRPDYAAAHYALGLILSPRPETQSRAKQHYERFLQLAPNDRSAPVIRQWLSGH